MKPKIRIKGFNDAWEYSYLYNCLDISTEVNKENKYGKDEVLSVSDDFGVVNQIKHLGRSYAGKSVSGYKILLPGQIVYTKSPLRDKPFGIIKENNYQAGIVSVLYAVYNVKEGIFSKYIQRYFEPKQRINKYLIPLVNKGAKNTMNISDEMSLNGKITKPVTICEQQAICSYFDKVDELISTASSRLASLKQVKEASLQAMFPQKGETVPKIRFKGFEGEWVITKAAAIFKTVNERNFSGLPVLSATQDKGMVTRDSIGYNIFHDKSNESTYKHILPGQFVMHLRSFQGGFAHSAIEGICSPAYTIMEFKDKEKNHDLYWKYVLASKRFIKSLEMITYGIRDGRTISFDEFKEMVFLVPKVEEQQRIASYFTSLDRQIDLQTQRLEKLRQIKAACLDKMFV
ncbi:restriction endonuclease subunit S [Prevotella jejuni]